MVFLWIASDNIHSIFNKGEKWTGCYWDEFASLPAVVPNGPIAIFGLAGGTAAHLMLDLWPSLQLEGWEIDEIVLDTITQQGDVQQATNIFNTTSGGYSLMDTSTLHQLQQVQMSNFMSQPQLLWDVDENRQKSINQSGFTNNLSYHLN